MHVKNTFIECPATPAGGIPAPLASAPAQCAYTLKDSLAAAAGTKVETFVPAPTPAREDHAVLANRRKPDPLKHVSTNSMMSILESPSGNQMPIKPIVQVAQPVKYVTIPGSVPQTPAMAQYDATPTGTPMAVPMRTTLSLVQMIQSPKMEIKSEMLNTAYTQCYRVAPAPTVVPGTVATTQAFVNGLAPMATVPAAPIGSYPVQAPVSGDGPPSQPLSPQVVHYQGLPVATTPVEAAVHPTASERVPPAQTQTVAVTAVADGSPLASIKLGLVTGGSQVITGPPQATAVVPQTYLPMHQAPVIQQGSYSSTSMATVMSYPAPATMIAPPQYQAPCVVQHHRFVPPPPLAPAPTILATPKGFNPMPATPLGVPATSVDALPVLESEPPSAGMPEADLKVLLDMAAASGNQAAVDVLMRQAISSGMSAEQFNSLCPSAIA